MIAGTYLSLLDRAYSAEDLAKGMIKTIDTMMMMMMMMEDDNDRSSYKKTTTTSNDKVKETLNKVRQDLSQLDFTN